MNTPDIQLRPATPADLPAINQVIEAAVMTWDLPERVKRLSLPSYRYDAIDLRHLILLVAESPTAGIIGVAAWEGAAAKDCPPGRTALLLHGLYVDPAAQGQGVGSRLLTAAEGAARRARVDGLLVKAQADATGFFARHGMVALPADEPSNQYGRRYWKPLRDSGDDVTGQPPADSD